MTKAELVSAIAAKADINKSAAEKVLNSFVEAVTETLVSEQKVALSGFGSLVVEARKERTGRNPQTGDPMEIPAGKVVKFRPGKALKDAVRA